MQIYTILADVSILRLEQAIWSDAAKVLEDLQ